MHKRNLAAPAIGFLAAFILLDACENGAAEAPDNDVDQMTSTTSPGTAPSPKSLGHEAGPHFVTKFENGLESDHYRVSDYGIEGNWIATAFIPENATFKNSRMMLAVSDAPARDKPKSSAEFQRIGFYGYGRYEVVMRGIAGAGVVTSFFTHTHGQFDDPHDEIDIELLGKNPRQMHINHFKDGKAAGSTYISLPFNFSHEAHLYAFEWTPEHIRWFVEDRLVFEATEGLPTHAGRVIANTWVAGPDTYDWLGAPKFGNGDTGVYSCMSHLPLGQTGEQCSDTWDVRDLAFRSQ